MVQTKLLYNEREIVRHKQRQCVVWLFRWKEMWTQHLNKCNNGHSRTIIQEVSVQRQNDNAVSWCFEPSQPLGIISDNNAEIIYFKNAIRYKVGVRTRTHSGDLHCSERGGIRDRQTPLVK